MKSIAARLGLAAFAVGLAMGPTQAQEYKIGYITDLSGPLAGSYTPTWQGFELYMKALNDRGGVNGRKIKISLDDDGLRADRAVAAAKKQVERDEVLGIFGLSLSSTIGPVLGEMRKSGVPVASTFSAILDALPPAKPMYYSTGVTFEVAGEAIAVLSQRIAPKGKVVGVTFDSVGGRAALRHNKQMAEKLGYSWDEIVFPVRTADFMPFAQSAAALKPDIVVGHYGAEQNLGFVTALRSAGYTGPYVIAAYGASEATVKQAARQSGSGANLYIVSRFAPVTDAVPGTKAIKDAAAKYGLADLNSMHVTGWMLGAFAEEALKKCGASCTRELLDKALQSVRIDTQGLTGGPIETKPGDHYGTTYWRLYRWEKDKLTGVGDWHSQSALTFPTQ
ncbi:MAG: ABC transporter substrate-binding protein [Hyphomonadaceae bacterium]|nr:ABC transporter substrate-binding protein [Hyphomonadaceae bacterium]